MPVSVPLSEMQSSQNGLQRLDDFERAKSGVEGRSDSTRDGMGTRRARGELTALPRAVRRDGGRASARREHAYGTPKI